MVAVTKVNLNDNDPNSDAAERAQKYLAEIDAQFQAAFALEQILEKDAPDIAKEEQELEELKQKLSDLRYQFHVDVDLDVGHYKDAKDLENKLIAALDKAYPNGWRGNMMIQICFRRCVPAEGSPSANLLKDLYVKRTEVDAAEAKLKEIDPGVTDLIDKINTLMHALGGQAIVNKFVAQDLASINKFFGSLFTALKQKLEADEYRQMIEKGGDALSDADIQKLFLDIIRLSLGEQTTLFDLEDQAAAETSNWRQIENHAQEQKDRVTAWTDFCNFFTGGKGKDEYDRTIHNAKMMEGILHGLMTGLSNELASLSPEFMEMKMTLDALAKEVDKAWHSNLSPKEKMGVILNVLGMVLSLIGAIESEVAAERANFDKRVAVAMQNASMMSVQDSVSLQQQIHNLQKAQSEMKKVIFAAKIIMSVAAFGLAAASGFILTPFVIAALSALELSGGVDKKSIMDKVTDQLTRSIDKSLRTSSRDDENDPFQKEREPSQIAKILAEVIMGLSETLLFAGATAGDYEIAAAAATTEAAEAAIQAVMTVVQDQIEAATRQAVVQAEAGIGRALTEEEVQTLTAALKDPVEKAAREVLKKSAQVLAKSGARGDVFRLSQGSYLPAQDAVKEAVREGVEQLSRLDGAQLLARSSLSKVVLEKEAGEVADRAVMKEFQLTGKQLAQVNEDISKQVLTRSMWMGTYALSSNNFFLDSVIQAMKATGQKEGDKVFEDVKNLVAALQALMAVLGMYMASNSPQVAGGGLPIWASRLATVAQLTSGGTTGVAEGSLANTSYKQAQLLPRVAKDKANIDAFSLMLKKLASDQQTDQDRHATESSNAYASSGKVIRDGALTQNLDISSVILASAV